KGQFRGSEQSHEGNGSGKSPEASVSLKGPFGVFLFFLEKGRLPNWVPVGYKPEGDWLKSLDPGQLDILRRLFQRSEQAVLRLASKFSVAFILKILENFEPEKSIFSNWKWIDAHLLTTAADRSIFKRYYWSHALSSYFFPVQEKPVSKMEQDRQILLKALKKFPDKLLVSLKATLPGQSIPDTVRKSLTRSLDTLIAEKGGKTNHG